MRRGMIRPMRTPNHSTACLLKRSRRQIRGSALLSPRMMFWPRLAGKRRTTARDHRDSIGRDAAVIAAVGLAPTVRISWPRRVRQMRKPTARQQISASRNEEVKGVTGHIMPMGEHFVELGRVAVAANGGRLAFICPFAQAIDEAHIPDGGGV